MTSRSNLLIVLCAGLLLATGTVGATEPLPGGQAVGDVAMEISAHLEFASTVAPPWTGLEATISGAASLADGTGITGIQVEYRPTLQTQHLGLFGSMTVIALAVGYWIVRTRRTRGAHLFAIVLFLVGLRTASDVLHGLVGELWTLQAVLVAVNPLLELWILFMFVRFAARYAGVQWLTTREVTWAMVGVVVAVAGVVATNRIHGLVFTALLRIEIPFTHVGAQLGLLGYGLVAANATLLLVGAGLLAHAFTTGERVAWWPATVLSIAVAQAVLVGGLQLRLGGVLPHYNYSTIGLGGFVFLTTLALLDHGLRRIEVIAREEVVDELDDAVVLIDDEGTVVDYNTAAMRLFRNLEEGVSFADRFDESDRLALGAEGGRSEVSIDPSVTTIEDPARADTVGPREDGDEPQQNGADASGPTRQHEAGRGGARDFLVYTTRVTAATNEMLGYAVRFVDVTELKERSRELQRKNEQLDQFASTVSHDLRNPLNVASGFVEMASQPVRGDDGDFDLESAVTYLEKVDVSLARMNAIIEDILALLENADPVTETEPVEFEGVARDAWRSVDTRDATLVVHGRGRVEADPDRLQRLLENLFRNAIDHVGDDVTIETGLADGECYVADDGPGIPENQRDRIFEHGFTTGEDGTGLGLSIVEQLAEAHGWSVTLDPDHDGARFVVHGCETTTGSATTPTE